MILYADARIERDRQVKSERARSLKMRQGNNTNDTRRVADQSEGHRLAVTRMLTMLPVEPISDCTGIVCMYL